MSDIFEKGIRNKVRYSTSKGLLSIEDLYDLSLESLDVIAIGVDKDLETAGKKSFIGKRNTANTALQLKLDIVKHVIEVKLAEKEAKANKAAKAAKIIQLKEIIGRKSLTELENKSTDDLLKELEALEAEE